MRRSVLWLGGVEGGLGCRFGLEPLSVLGGGDWVLLDGVDATLPGSVSSGFCWRDVLLGEGHCYPCQGVGLHETKCVVWGFGGGRGGRLAGS